jgi:hypothetical protein
MSKCQGVEEPQLFLFIFGGSKTRGVFKKRAFLRLRFKNYFSGILTLNFDSKTPNIASILWVALTLGYFVGIGGLAFYQIKKVELKKRSSLSM